MADASTEGEGEIVAINENENPPRVQIGSQIFEISAGLLPMAWEFKRARTRIHFNLRIGSDRYNNSPTSRVVEIKSG